MVLGTWVADLGVFKRSVGGISVLMRMEEPAGLKRLCLLAWLAVESAEDHPEGVDRSHKRTCVAGDVEDPVPAALCSGDVEDQVLGEEA